MHTRPFSCKEILYRILFYNPKRPIIMKGSKCHYCQFQIPYKPLTFESKLFEHVADTTGHQKEAEFMTFCRSQNQADRWLPIISSNIENLPHGSTQRTHDLETFVTSVKWQDDGCYSKYKAMRNRISQASAILKECSDISKLHDNDWDLISNLSANEFELAQHIAWVGQIWK
jgi:hypothetical protein